MGFFIGRGKGGGMDMNFFFKTKQKVRFDKLDVWVLWGVGFRKYRDRTVFILKKKKTPPPIPLISLSLTKSSIPASRFEKKWGVLEK